MVPARAERPYDAAAWAAFVLKFWLLLASADYIIADTVVARPALVMRALRARSARRASTRCVALVHGVLFQSLAEYPDDWLGLRGQAGEHAAGWLVAALFLLLDAAVGLALALAVERPMGVGRRVEAALDG